MAIGMTLVLLPTLILLLEVGIAVVDLAVKCVVGRAEVWEGGMEEVD